MGIKNKHELNSPCVYSIILEGCSAELENTRLGGNHSELVSLT